MSGAPIEPMDPELASLLGAERGATPSKEALDRVWTHVARTIPVGGGPAGGQGAGGSGAGGGWLASHAVGVAVAAFVAGAATGAAALSLMPRAAPERILYVERPAPPMRVVEPRPAAAPSTTSPASIAAPPADSPPVVRSPVPSAPSSLSLERGVLDDARAALSSGDAARALRLSDEHLRRFPKAQLGEEREALAIQSLVALGRYDEARARAARFRAATPHSVMLPAIDAALGSIP